MFPRFGTVFQDSVTYHANVLPYTVIVLYSNDNCIYLLFVGCYSFAEHKNHKKLKTALSIKSLLIL